MIGETVGDYEILQSLGKGGFGSVWKAKSSEGKDVALKILNPQVLENEKVVKKFFHEAMILARLDHPNICKLMEFFPNGNNYAIAMEYVPGNELKKILQQHNGPLPFEAAYKIAKQSLDAFQYADENGILHRDIKPANIMIDTEGNIKVMDFGIAKMGTTASHDTAASMLSIHYTPPERFDKTKEIDVRSDIYALGLVLYELFAGRRPFSATETTQIMFFHLNEIPKPPDTYSDSLPPNISQAISKSLEKEPDDRFQSFKEFSQALDTGEPVDEESTMILDLDETLVDQDFDVGAARPTPAVKVEAPKKKSKALLLSIACAVLMTLAGGLYFLLNRTLPIPGVTSLDVSVVSPGKGFEGDSFKIKLITNETAETTFIVLDGKELAMEGEGTQWHYVAKVDKPGATTFSVFAKNKDGVQGQPKEGSITALEKPPLDTGVKNAKGFWEAAHPADGSKMVMIPGGEFTMGSDEYSAEKPIQKIHLDMYFIDKYLVTNESFQKFIEATGYVTDSEKDGAGMVRLGRRWKKMAGANWKMPDGMSAVDEKENHPVSQVSYDDALNYCQWAKKDLPTEAQWEKAARGPEALQYPWGNSEPDDTMANFENIIGHPTPVTDFEKGQSHYGLHDMGGNLAQWCKDWYATGERALQNPSGPETGEERVIKGGSFRAGIDTLRSANRDRYEPAYSSFLFGFRCSSKIIEPEAEEAQKPGPGDAPQQAAGN